MRDDGQGLDRRDFLRGAATGAALTAMPLGAAPALAHGRHGGHGHEHRSSIPRENISIQLYTLRDQMAADTQGTLKALARIGYRSVEHAGFAGHTAAEFKTALRNAGLRATSGHQGMPQPYDAAAWQAQINDALTIGQRYIVNPASPITFFPTDGDLSKIRGLATAAAWRAYAADLNKAGAAARAAGLRLGFHNHFWEWAPLEDDTPLTGYDILIAETDPRLVHFEVDLFWAWFAHRDPVGLLAHVGDRIRQFHVKDMRYVNHTPTFADPGTGVIDFARIFAAAGSPRDHQYIVERDDAGANALNTATVGFNFLSRIRF
jgi:sugar phosphate isomerase/epimerase